MALTGSLWGRHGFLKIKLAFHYHGQSMVCPWCMWAFTKPSQWGCDVLSLRLQHIGTLGEAWRQCRAHVKPTRLGRQEFKAGLATLALWLGYYLNCEKCIETAKHRSEIRSCILTSPFFELLLVRHKSPNQQFVLPQQSATVKPWEVWRRTAVTN